MSVAISANFNRMFAATLPEAEAKAIAKNEKAARDFEAVLLTPVFDALQKTFAGDAQDDKTTGASDFRQMGSQALAQAIAARGGIGIAKLILRHLPPPKAAAGS